MQVVDTRSGQTIEVPDEKVQAGFQSGAYSLPRGTRIPITRADGDIGTVSAEHLNEELGAGAAIVPQADYDKAVAQAKYGGLGGMATTAGLGALSGATGTLSDIALAKLSPTTRKYVQEHYLANPTTKTVAQVGGAIAPALATGGASLEAEGALGAAAALGEATAARGVLGAGGEAALALRGGGALAEAAPVANEIGIAGRLARGAYNTVTAPSRYTAEAGQFAERLIGSVVGDNSPSLLARTAQKALAKGGAGALEGTIYELENQVSEDALGDHETTGGKLFAAAGHGALFGGLLGGGLGAAGELGGAAFGKIAKSETLQKLSDNQFWRAVNPTKAATKDANKIKGGARGVGRQLGDDGVVEIGDNIDSIAPKVSAKKAEVFDEYGKVINEVDGMGAKGVLYDALRNKIDSDIPDIVKKLGEGTPEHNAVSTALFDMSKLVKEDGRIPLKDLHEYRKRLDDLIKHNQVQKSPATAVLEGIRANVEDAFIKQADHEAARLGGHAVGDLQSIYKDVKLRAQRYIVADRAAQLALAAKYSNQSLSLTDKMGGIGFGAAAVAGHIATGGAGLAGHAAHAALGLVAAYGSKLVRERGNATVAAVLRKARDLGAVAQVTKHFDNRMGKEIAKAVHGHPFRGASVDLDDYDGVAERVRAAKDMAVHKEAVDAHLGSLRDTAPKTSAAFDSTARRATMLLVSKLPKQTYHPMGEPPPPSDADKSALLRTERAIEDPLVILKDLRAGTLAPDTLETVKKVHPQIYAQLQSEVSKQLKQDSTIPYARKMQMSRMLGLDLDGTMDPRFVEARQAAYAVKPQKPSQGTGKHRKANLQSKTPMGMTLQSRLSGTLQPHL